ncbi:MAG: hypothetical protein HY820_39555 [Acidobacteria bacterium]|nr:hypothetical protein [Acidobacteriota bacterium]
MLLLAPLCFAERSAPSYTAATLVNSATELPIVSPGTLVSIYGKDLATSSRDLKTAHIGADGLLPVGFPGTGVTVLVHGLPAPLFSVGPEKITFFIPFELPASEDVFVWVTTNGSSGPRLTVHLYRESPGLFLLEPGVASAAHKDNAAITAENPAFAGEEVTLFATGLGPTTPPLEYRQVAPDKAPMQRLDELKVLLNGRAVDQTLIRYAGAVGGTAGMYRIDLTLPQDTPPDPEVRIALGDSLSPEGVQLKVK